MWTSKSICGVDIDAWLPSRPQLNHRYAATFGLCQLFFILFHFSSQSFLLIPLLQPSSFQLPESCCILSGHIYSNPILTSCCGLVDQMTLGSSAQSYSHLNFHEEPFNHDPATKKTHTSARQTLLTVYTPRSCLSADIFKTRCYVEEVEEPWVTEVFTHLVFCRVCAYHPHTNTWEKFFYQPCVRICHVCRRPTF